MTPNSNLTWEISGLGIGHWKTRKTRMAFIRFTIYKTENDPENIIRSPLARVCPRKSTESPCFLQTFC